VPARNLCGRPPVTDCFGKQGRAWLASLQLPIDERLTLDGCLRQIDFLDAEIDALDAALAERALRSPQILRLMTVPGVNVNTAAAFMASVGDIRRFSSARRLVGYLGLDPRVRQSGNADARHGHISKAGSSLARGMLGEAAWSAAQTPGPLRAFFERVRARKGPQVAATATARQARVPVLVPAHPRRGLRVRAALDDPIKDPPARARRRRPAPQGRAWNRRQQERRTGEGGCGRDTGARISTALEGQSRAADSVKPQRSALRFVSHPHPSRGSHHHPTTST
jgi:hypothetical protein